MNQKTQDVNIMNTNPKNANQNKKSKLPKAVILLLIIAAIPVVILLGARLYFRVPVADYYRASEKTFVIPETNDGFIAQGIAYQDGQFYITGYMKDGSASPIYIVDEATRNCIQKVYQYTPEQEPYHGHCGGIHVNKNYIYVAAGKGLCVYDRQAVESASYGSNVPYLGTFSLEGDDSISVAWITGNENQLIIGEFYRDVVYPTPDSHKLTTPSGDYNQALALVYPLIEDESAIYGISPTPIAAYSLPNQVQGVALKDNKIYCSTSYGAAFSHILEYDLDKASIGTISTMEQSLPLTYLDSSCMLRDIKFPPMSEEIIFVNDRLVTMCESASNKYIFGKFTSAKWCYGTDISELK